jgi:hypothetical protein
MPRPFRPPTLLMAIAVCGALDLASAFVFAGMKGAGPPLVLRSVASGPFGDAMLASGAPGAVLGLVTHFAIMTVMVLAFAALAARAPGLLARPLLAGTAWGVLLYGVMYWIVLPLRWPALHPQTGAWQVGNALFSHIVCVGIPMALILARDARPARAVR